MALETAELHAHESPPIPRHSSTDSEQSRSPSARGKLRYEAYEPPPPASRLTPRRRASSVTSVDSHGASSQSSHSDLTNPYSHFREPRIIGFKTAKDPEDGLSRTLTAGDLAMAAHELNFSRSGLVDSSTELLVCNPGLVYVVINTAVGNGHAAPFGI